MNGPPLTSAGCKRGSKRHGNQAKQRKSNREKERTMESKGKERYIRPEKEAEEMAKR